ncbi:hypothetical protein ACIBQ3_34395 [Streptomyces rubiginosohelvolus]|uniref:hypothetical protein n=1 Tax=Streptomyces rubiginosohelvolus TaxID=67362 RepID=UPI0037910F5E
MTARALPAIATLTEAQQRGWECVWCHAALGIGLGDDVGEQRARPSRGAAYSWFPRQCPDVVACQAREADAAVADRPERQLPTLADLTWDQAAGRACVWCKKLLDRGAVSAGVIHERDGAHVLDTEVWAGPCCTGGA